MIESPFQRREPLIRDLMKKSEYMSRHLPLAGHTYLVFQHLLDPTLPEVNLSNLRRGAMLHDVGKQAAIDILEKSELTQEERELMHWHPQIGASLLGSLYGRSHPFTWMAEGHHERWDGRGYPVGVSGDSIPYYARVMTLADIYSTITQPRPYDAHVHTPVEALTVLEEDAGKIFDPHMVKILVPKLAKLIETPDVESYPKEFRRSFDYMMRASP